MKKKKSISLFSGAMGLDLGMEAAGITTAVVLEKNAVAVQTIKLNKGGKFPIIACPIEKVTTDRILKDAKLKKGEPFVVVGGPCCQSFSTAGTRRSVSDARKGSLFRHFKRVVSKTQPRFFVMENVKGMLSAAVKHRPLDRRGSGFPALSRNEELGSALKLIRRELAQLNYHVVFGLVNCADYGVPQKRYRLLFIGSRDGEDINLPPKTHSENTEPGKNAWVSMRQAFKGMVEPKPEYSPFAPDRENLLKLLREGQNWLDLPKHLHRVALGGAYESWGGRVGFCRRLVWDKPTPTLTTDPKGRATTLCHPTEIRPLTVREYARLQQFPDSWQFAGALKGKYIQLGNAVPVGLGKAIGHYLLKVARKTDRNGLSRGYRKRLGKVECADPSLKLWLEKRKKTQLHPARLRKNKSPAAARSWMSRQAA